MENTQRKLECLVCLSNTNNALIDIFSKTGIALGIHDVLAKHFWFQCNQNESHKICLECWNTIKDFHDFYNKIERLHELMNIQIKEEPDIEIIDSDDEPEICIDADLFKVDLNVRNDFHEVKNLDDTKNNTQEMPMDPDMDSRVITHKRFKTDKFRDTEKSNENILTESVSEEPKRKSCRVIKKNYPKTYEPESDSVLKLKNNDKTKNMIKDEITDLKTKAGINKSENIISKKTAKISKYK